MEKTVKSRHPIAALLASQFLGAFNDNALKMMVVFVGTALVAGEFSVGGERDAEALVINTTSQLALTVPLFLLALPSGILADRFSKRNIIVALKGLEVALMATAAVLWFVMPGAYWPLIAVLAGMGLQSALFSPAKYGILPELLDHKDLSKGNAWLEGLTFLAIIFGTGLGGWLLSHLDAGPSASILAVLAGVGLAFAVFIPKVPVARADGSPTAGIVLSWREFKRNRVLRLTILGTAVFWLLASLLGANVMVHATNVLRLEDSVAGFPLAVFGLGVGAGSILAARLSRNKVEYGLIPMGAMGLALLTFGMAMSPSLTATYILMALLGISAGVLLVPLQAVVQWQAPRRIRGSVLGLSNVFIFGGMLVGSGVGLLFGKFQFSPSLVFLIAGIGATLGTLWALWLLPEALVRFGLTILTNTFYRIHIRGAERVPTKGPALLVSNHLSLMDGLFVLASTSRDVRFIVDKDYFNHPILRPFMKLIGAIPVSATGSPKEIMRSLKNAGKYLDEGEVVCIFAEGQISRIGMLLPFRRGLELIMKGRDAPIIPMHLDRVWGSAFSPSGGKGLRPKFPRRVPWPVTVSFGEPMAPNTPREELRNAIQTLSEEAWDVRKRDMMPLAWSFVKSSRRRRLGMLLADPVRGELSALKSLAGILALGRALRPIWKQQKRVGILLPPSNAGAVVNIAATLGGRTTVNLNYTVGKQGLESSCLQSEIRTVVTSKAFIEKANLELPENVELHYLEDLAPKISTGNRIHALVAALFAPYWMLERHVGCIGRPKMDDVATIIFSSGSTGEPKGVMLTHFNILSNVEGVGQVLQFNDHDRLLHMLPFFHSFGYMLLWTGMHFRASCVFAPNPLDPLTVGSLCQKYRLTALCATPTFLGLYLKRIPPGQFGSIRLIVAGAEKLPRRLADAFHTHFGVEILEGYGATECAPAIAINAPDYRAAGFFQKGSRAGTVGRALPGVATRVVDPDTGEPVPTGEPGMLLVKGPNVMQGYLNKPELTDGVLNDGWYRTGDIVKIDEDGFIAITDRLSRFSKIGGEMVPHGKVEEALCEAYGGDEVKFAVTCVPDEKKGERLAVLHMVEEDRIEGLLEKLKADGMPNLFMPRANDFVKVDELPLLGTGKLDLRGIKAKAREALIGD